MEGVDDMSTFSYETVISEQVLHLPVLSACLAPLKYRRRSEFVDPLSGGGEGLHGSSEWRRRSELDPVSGGPPVPVTHH